MDDLNKRPNTTPETLPDHDERADTGPGGHDYDDDGALAQQTPGLDPEPIRKEAGPDWPAGTKGDLEADTAPSSGSGASQADADTGTNR